MIKCGVAQVDITPYLGSDIPGQIYNRTSEGIKDRLYAKAIVFDDGNKRIASVVLDTIVIESETVNEIREKAAEKCELEKGAIMVSAIHTHTGPPVGDLYKSQKDERYLHFLAQKASDSICIANKNLQNAKIGVACGYEDAIGFNRRYKMKDGTYRTNPGVLNPNIDKVLGPIDPDVTVIRVDDENGNPIAVMSNYACHLDVVGGNEYSADYPGQIARTISSILGKNVVSLFYTGTCGNINHVNFTMEKGIPSDKGKKYSDYMGRVLAYEILKTREKTITTTDYKLNFLSETISLETRKPDSDMLKAAYEKVKNNPDESIFNEIELIKYAENPKTRLNAEIQVMSIGNTAIVALPGEIFVEFGLEIKKKSPFKYNLIAELSNGSLGYIPVREAFAQGGYEPSLTSYTCAAPDSGYFMTDKVLELMKKL